MLRIRSPTKDQILSQLMSQSGSYSSLRHRTISPRSAWTALALVLALFLLVSALHGPIQQHLDARAQSQADRAARTQGDWDPLLSAPAANGTADPARQRRVRAAVQHAWEAYSRQCWGRDQIHPSTGACSDLLGMGVTIVDAMDTLWVVGLEAEYTKARDWVVESMTLQATDTVSVFETIIRVIGGMLAAYEVSGEKDTELLGKTKLLGELLMPAFESRTGLPYPRINLKTGSVGFHDWGDWFYNKVCIAELASLELEFAVLSYHTNDPKYLRIAMNALQVIEKADKEIPGLYPVYMDIKYGTFYENVYSIGSMADSFYEYLLKMWIISDKSAFAFRKMYSKSAKAIIQNLMRRSPSGLLYIGRLNANGEFEEEMEHLTCFFPGVLALGSYFRASDDNEENEEYLKIAEDLAWSCYSMYSHQTTKLSPDKASFKEKKPKPTFASYHLRPETIESLFILYRITGKQNYREMAWDIFQSIEKHCQNENGFSPLSDVNIPKSQSDGPMETFLIAETLKYLYLIFSDSNYFPLDDFVFNTEAHLFKIRRNLLHLSSRK
jgi:mannosyl-oligosaccharide alpha-1,2-mannosidase